MRKTDIYKPLTKPELFFGVDQASLPYLAILIAILMIVKIFLQYSILYLLGITAVVYILLVIAAKIDPFYFTIRFKKSMLRTSFNHKDKGNLYVG
jgi:type IV secretory pathway VirB3-like protein